MHLTPEQFIEVIEGERDQSSLPHLVECRACRDQLASMRATMGAALDADVPEPPPFFWERLSAEVRDRVAAESTRRQWWINWSRPAFLVPATAVIALLVTIVAVPRIRLQPGDDVRAPNPVATASAAPTTLADPANDAGDPIDPLLTLVADLSANMDWDAAADAGFTEPGGADQAVTHMSVEELRALRQLLQKEMGTPGA